ncbi:PREDICTED: solute carrier family 25 member 38-like isoform X2 [Priapulus caudatus]|uniref:Solute carrier family 25 member 38-like isoform X2 n=1 Tax=Priapulus caudatus TaxID=37621 RepID=A0ABM1DTE7_PRICU|nr:PREDICTED: solute carrier family 25 member 38-like isoform X2 [Priapulus caudatus]XP_014663219.1 PREDICTED: solute carrier family 25 member 38-like isoform X2 [Priapulus caudatus]
MTVKAPNLTDLRERMDAVISNPLVKSFAAGSFSGTCSTVIFQPLDLVKTRIQSPGSGKTSGAQGLLSVIAQVVRKERFIGLWKGMTPSITRTIPGVGIYFCSLHWLKTNIGPVDTHSPLQTIGIGAGARCVSGIAMLPFTVIKTRFESNYFQYRGIIHALRDIYAKEGIAGLYSGFSATLLRDAPFSGLYLVFYTQGKKLVPHEAMDSNYVPLIHFGCGVSAGVLASVVTQPADVIKTNMQLFPRRFDTVFNAIGFVYKLYNPVCHLGLTRGRLNIM